MVDFGYNNNAIRNQKHFKPIANGNVADSGMIALKKNGSLNVNLVTHQLLLLPIYKKIQVNSLLNVFMLLLFIFISTLTNIRQIKLIFL